MEDRPLLEKRVFVTMGDNEFRTAYVKNDFETVSQRLKGKSISELIRTPDCTIRISGSLRLFRDRIEINTGIGNFFLKIVEIDCLSPGLLQVQIRHHAPLKRYLFIRHFLGGISLFTSIKEASRKNGLALRFGNLKASLLIGQFLLGLLTSALALVSIWFFRAEAIIPVVFLILISCAANLTIVIRAWKYVDR
jgi:hypothetical protein